MYERIFLSPPCRDQACLLCSILFFFFNAQILYVWRRTCRTSVDFFDLTFFYKSYFAASFFCLLKLCKALAHPYFYQIGISFHLIPSKSQEQSHPNSPRLQKLCTLLRAEYSSSVPLFSTQGLWHSKSLLLNSGAPGEWYDCGHMSLILNSYPSQLQ